MERIKRTVYRSILPSVNPDDLWFSSGTTVSGPGQCRQLASYWTRRLITRKTSTDDAHATLWQALPMEIVIMVVDGLICGKYIDHPYESQRMRALRTISLVCSEWLWRCGPELYKRIRIPSTQIDDLCLCLRTPYSRLRLMVREVTVEFVSPLHILSLGKLRHLLPHVTTFGVRRSIWSNKPNGQQDVHHSLSRTATGLLASFADLSCVQLWDCQFHNSFFLLHVIGSLPSLSQIDINTCTWEYSSFAVPLRRSTRLKSINISRSTEIWPFLLTCIWSRLPDGDHRDQRCFAGICGDDAVTAARLCSCLSAGRNHYGQLRLRKSCHPETWVVILQTNFHFVELYLTHESLLNGESNAQDRVRIRWIVIRTGGASPATKKVARETDHNTIVDHLSCFPFLEKIVFERRENDEDAVELITCLEKLGTVVRRTWKESEQYASAAKANSLSSVNGLPISPLWYDDEFEEQRNLYRVGRS